jgi:hypothetical protein
LIAQGKVVDGDLRRHDVASQLTGQHEGPLDETSVFFSPPTSSPHPDLPAAHATVLGAVNDAARRFAVAFGHH